LSVWPSAGSMSALPSTRGSTCGAEGRGRRGRVEAEGGCGSGRGARLAARRPRPAARAAAGRRPPPSLFSCSLESLTPTPHHVDVGEAALVELLDHVQVGAKGVGLDAVQEPGGLGGGRGWAVKPGQPTAAAAAKHTAGWRAGRVGGESCMQCPSGPEGGPARGVLPPAAPRAPRSLVEGAEADADAVRADGLHHRVDDLKQQPGRGGWRRWGSRRWGGGGGGGARRGRRQTGASRRAGSADAGIASRAWPRAGHGGVAGAPAQRPPPAHLQRFSRLPPYLSVRLLVEAATNCAIR
jgi:hypothetical protein